MMFQPVTVQGPGAVRRGDQFFVLGVHDGLELGNCPSRSKPLVLREGPEMILLTLDHETESEVLGVLDIGKLGRRAICFAAQQAKLRYALLPFRTRNNTPY